MIYMYSLIHTRPHTCNLCTCLYKVAEIQVVVQGPKLTFYEGANWQLDKKFPLPDDKF